MIIDLKHKGPSPKTLNYLLLLFNELGFTINSRNVWLSNYIKRKLSYIDELTPYEASIIIDKLNEMRIKQNAK